MVIVKRVDLDVHAIVGTILLCQEWRLPILVDSVNHPRVQLRAGILQNSKRFTSSLRCSSDDCCRCGEGCPPPLPGLRVEVSSDIVCKLDPSVDAWDVLHK
eukprot:scaffold27788_cov76-Amphora_coffeaeformis.AAC.1